MRTDATSVANASRANERCTNESRANESDTESNSRRRARRAAERHIARFRSNSVRVAAAAGSSSSSSDQPTTLDEARQSLEVAGAHSLEVAGDDGGDQDLMLAGDDEDDSQPELQAAVQRPSASSVAHRSSRRPPPQPQQRKRGVREPSGAGGVRNKGKSPGATSLRTVRCTSPAERTPHEPTPKRKPTAAEAVAELKLQTFGRDDWIEVFAKEPDETNRMLLAAKSSFARPFGQGGILYALTPDACAYCLEETTECFPCAGAHKVCHKCRAENQEHANERCPACRTVFNPEALGPKFAGIYDRTFENVCHPKLKELQTLKVMTSGRLKPQLAEAERQAEEDADEVIVTRRLKLDCLHARLLSILTDRRVEPLCVGSSRRRTSFC